LRVLTIRQPWAYAIMELGKDVENRTWPTEYRGPLIVHSSVKPEPSNILEPYVSKAVMSRLDDSEMALGAILGVVDLVDCIEDSTSKWADDPDDAWHWILKNPRKLSKPIFCKGSLGLWKPPANAIDALKRLR
jgi:hypothetical protein